MATAFEPLEGKYEILEKIREGGMGSVYKVRHRLLDELRVVKVMRPQLAEDEVLRARFLREAKVAIRLHHPNLAQIYDFTVDETGYAYLVMEFIDGLALQDVIKVLGRPALGLMLEIADQSLDAIGYLHRKRIIHRDISPDNLLVTRDEDRALHVKLIDLGIAKDREVEDSLTSAGTFLGKVRYSSPEHFRTHEGAQVGVRSDLYSFGVVLYEMLTGAYPIRGSSVASLISGHLMHPPLEFETSDPDGLIPEGLRATVLRALSKEPDGRFSDAADFRAALAPFRAEHPVEAAHLAAVFEVPTQTTRRIRTIKPGSTQSRMNRSFGMSTTPPPSEIDDLEDRLESSGTVDTGSQGGQAPPAEESAALKAQIHALLLGAGKLVEGRHFDEARLQLATVLELAPGNPEGIKLQQTLEAADLKMQQRRQREADAVRQAILGEQYERAGARLDDAVDRLGAAPIFEQLRGELAEALERHQAKLSRLRAIESEAGELIAAERFDEAVELAREGLELSPGHREIGALLERAESGGSAQLEAARRAAEIADTAAGIAAQIESGHADEAERALQVAVKLYGEQNVFTTLGEDLERLRDRLREAEADELRKRARGLLESADFAAAIAVLEKAHDIAPGSETTDELMAAAREGMRLEEEARLRRIAIDETTLQVDRLIAAGRLESAVRVIDETVRELGEFEQADELRSRVERESRSCLEREAAVREVLERALEESANERFADAEEAVEEARRLAEDDPETGDLVAETEAEIRRRIEAHRRQIAIDKVIQSINRQLDKSTVDEARRELAVAQRLYGSSDALDALAAAIDERGRELRRLELDRLIAAALANERSFEEAIADLEAASALDPQNEKVQRLLARTRAEHRRFLDDEAANRAGAALAEIDRLIASGEPTAALRALDRTVAEHGDFRLARMLRRRLAGQT
jgi:serine/threonine protein kinase